MVNVGVIGVGYLGQHHARIYSQLEGVRLSAVVDTDPAQAESVAHRYGGTACADYREILGEVDAVSIVTPTTAHYEIARECIRAGKDVMIEKPVTAELADADALVEEAEKAGIIAQVGHLERFNPAVLAVYPLIEEPRFIEAERLSPFLGRGTDVDITLDLMIHDIDIILAILARGRGGVSLKDSKAVVAKVLTEKIDVAKVWLEFDNGAQALLTASRLSPEKSRKLKIFQENSYLLVDYQLMEIRRFMKNGGKISQETVTVEKCEPLKEELRDFIECVVSRRDPVVSLRDGRNALALALQIGERLRL
ncbi:MAG: Gfo/Idh/MocA family oxidoreductase [Chloroflexota bacterium]